jgi:hypothetical protein
MPEIVTVALYSVPLFVTSKPVSESVVAVWPETAVHETLPTGLLHH